MGVARLRSRLILFPLAAWALFAAVSYSYFADPAADECTSDALWASGWFVVPPVLALPGFFASRPYAAGSVVASLGLLAAWGISAFVWFITAVACGAG